MFSPQSVWRCLDPYPAALLRCSYPLLPAEHRPHLTCKRFRAETPAMIATSMANRFRGCSHSIMFRLPHLLGPPVAPTAEALCLLGSRAVYTTQRTCGYPPRTVVSLRA